MIQFDLVAVVATVTIIIGVTVKIVGMPHQIKENYRRKSTTGLSPVYWILAFTSYFMWMLYGILEHDWVLILGQGVGLFPTGFVLWQIYRYRNLKLAESQGKA